MYILNLVLQILKEKISYEEQLPHLCSIPSMTVIHDLISEYDSIQNNDLMELTVIKA